MLNIVHDNLPHSNVWFAPKSPKIFETSFSNQYCKPIPTFLHLKDNLVFHTSADGLDSFIYPILMHDPYVQVRSLIANYNPFGFWTSISDSVIQGLREKRGWIIIDIDSEPITQPDFDSLLESLSDSSRFPNDRILINTTSPHFAVNKRVFNHPSWLEMGCYITQIREGHSPCRCRINIPSSLSYPHKRFLLLNNHIDYEIATPFSKYANSKPDVFLNSSNDVYRSKTRSSNFLELPEALYATDINVVLEAYCDNKHITYPFLTEKTYRNIKYKKPFIIIGQQHTLKVLRLLGYKTFSPLIEESYDNLKDPNQRAARVLKELERLRKMNNSEWSSFLENCKPILEHNYNNLKNRINKTNIWLEKLKEL